MISLILGYMKSGKSKKLLELYNQTNLNITKSLIYIRPTKDTRLFVSRCNINIDDVNFGNETSDIEKYHYIFIDEFQFYPDDFISKIIKFSHDKNFIIAGLLSDINMKPWKNITTILPYCTEIIQFSSKCDDCRNSKFPIYHIGDGNVNDDYKVLCLKCKIKRNNEKY